MSSSVNARPRQSAERPRRGPSHRQPPAQRKPVSSHRTPPRRRSPALSPATSPTRRGRPWVQRLSRGLSIAALFVSVVCLTIVGLHRASPGSTSDWNGLRKYSAGWSAAGAAGDPYGAAQRSSAALSLAGVPDGPAPDRFDTGQPAMSSVALDDPGATFVVRNQRLTYEPTLDGPTAAYFSTPDLGGPISSIGAQFVFRAGQGGYGALALIVSKGVQQRIPQITTPISIHFVAVSELWNLGIVGPHDNAPLVIAEGAFKQPLDVNGETAYEISLKIDGSRVSINLPDGTSTNVTDPRIEEYAGNYATFELYCNQSLRDSIPAFDKIWATAG